ncbi:hypothetical protein E8E11_010329 [Didymella keratinophila]|nr:hypothetical protein E8E11_010329 [Didymella keratinophila]
MKLTITVVALVTAVTAAPLAQPEAGQTWGRDAGQTWGKRAEASLWKLWRRVADLDGFMTKYERDAAPEPARVKDWIMATRDADAEPTKIH